MKGRILASWAQKSPEPYTFVPVTIKIRALSLVESRSWSKFASHYAWGTNGVYKWMQDGCNIYMDSYMASNGSSFMVTWTIFKNHLLEVGLTQKQETMALRTLTTVNLFYFIMREDPREHKFIEMHLVKGPVTYGFTVHLRVCDHTTWCWRCVGTAFRHFLLGSHNFMVTALGSCVKWPLVLCPFIIYYLLFWCSTIKCGFFLLLPCPPCICHGHNSARRQRELIKREAPK